MINCCCTIGIRDSNEEQKELKKGYQMLVYEGTKTDFLYGVEQDTIALEIEKKNLRENESPYS